MKLKIYAKKYILYYTKQWDDKISDCFFKN